MHRQEFIKKYPDIGSGKVVYTPEGEKLGKLVAADDYTLTVEKGLFFPKEFTFSYDDVDEVSGDKVIINTAKEDLGPWRSESFSGWEDIERANREETRMPLHEEKLEVQKHTREAGQVRARKVVHTEWRQVSVPVSKEEVIIERVPASEAGKMSDRKAEFSEEEVTIPIREEEIEVKKRSVLKEEVRLSKKTHTEHHNVGDEVRSEDVEIERESEHKHKTKP
jgi:uncharacterized protein (TIGR02271 family)